MQVSGKMCCWDEVWVLYLVWYLVDGCKFGVAIAQNHIELLAERARDHVFWLLLYQLIARGLGVVIVAGRGRKFPVKDVSADYEVTVTYWLLQLYGIQFSLSKHGSL